MIAPTLLAIAFTGAGFQEPQVRWRYDAGAIVDYTEITPFGTLLVSTSKETVALQPDSGTVIWSSTELRDCRRSETLPQPACRYGRDGYRLHLYVELPVAILARSDHLVAFDLQAGKELWNSDVTGLPRSDGGWRLEHELGAVLIWNKPDKETPLRVTAIDLLEGRPRWTAELPLLDDVEMVLGRGVRMFLGRGSSGKKVLVAVEPGEGRVRFTSEELGPLFDRKGRRLGTADPLAVYGSPAVDHRATLGYDQEILYTGEKELTAFDLESGAVRWQVRDVEMDGWVYDGDALYVLGDKKLSAFRLADGSRKWSRKSREGSSLILTDHGLLLGCSSFSCWNEIELVDTTAGEPAWTAPAKLSEGSSAILWKGDHVLIATSEGVWRLDVASGAVSALASVEFRGNEGPTTIGETSRGLYVMSNQNVAVLDSAGSLRAHQYYKPPGLSTLEKIGRIALSTALTALSYAQASASASSMAKQNAFLSSMSGGSGVGRGFAFYQIHFPNLRARATATQRIDHLLYVYTEEADARGREGFSLVQFDASDGKEVGRAWVQQRRPKMRIDPVLNLVYVQRTLETVEAIGFEPARPSSGR